MLHSTIQEKSLARKQLLFMIGAFILLDAKVGMGAEQQGLPLAIQLPTMV